MSDLPIPVEPSPRKQTLVDAPQDFFLGPVFAAKKQPGPREVPVGDKVYVVGGFDPFNKDARPPALAVCHARALFTLLKFREDNQTRRAQRAGEDYDPQNIRFSMAEFCRAYASSNGGRYAREILKVLGDLAQAYISITEPDPVTGRPRTLIYRLIERVEIEPRPIKRRDAALATSNQMEMRFNYVRLSPEFYGLLHRVAELKSLKLEVLTSIRSPIAQAIYLYLPSRAVHHTEQAPFEITLTTIMDQISVPRSMHKSVRKKVFTQHEKEGRSILQQLDGLETLSGRFRVRLAETVDQDDYKLLVWVEQDHLSALRPATPKEESKLYRAFLTGGREAEDWARMLARVSPLSYYELDLLAAGAIERDRNLPFFERAKAILGQPRFDGLLAEAKCEHQEGVKPKKSPTARLIYRLMSAIAQSN